MRCNVPYVLVHLLLVSVSIHVFKRLSEDDPYFIDHNVKETSWRQKIEGWLSLTVQRRLISHSNYMLQCGDPSLVDRVNVLQLCAGECEEVQVIKNDKCTFVSVEGDINVHTFDAWASSRHCKLSVMDATQVKDDVLHLIRQTAVLYLFGMTSCMLVSFLYFGNPFVAFMCVVLSLYSFSFTYLVFVHVVGPQSPTVLLSLFISTGISVDDAFVLSTIHHHTSPFRSIVVQSVIATTAIDALSFAIMYFSPVRILSSAFVFTGTCILVNGALCLFFRRSFRRSEMLEIYRIERISQVVGVFDKTSHVLGVISLLVISYAFSRTSVCSNFEIDILSTASTLSNMMRCLSTTVQSESFVTVGLSQDLMYMDKTGDEVSVRNAVSAICANATSFYCVPQYVRRDDDVAAVVRTNAPEEHVWRQIGQMSSSKTHIEVLNDAQQIRKLVRAMLTSTSAGVVVVCTSSFVVILLLTRDLKRAVIAMCSTLYASSLSMSIFVAVSNRCFGIHEGLCVVISNTLALDYILHYVLLLGSEEAEIAQLRYSLMFCFFTTVSAVGPGMLSELTVFADVSKFILLSTGVALFTNQLLHQLAKKMGPHHVLLCPTQERCQLQDRNCLASVSTNSADVVIPSSELETVSTQCPQRWTRNATGAPLQ